MNNILIPVQELTRLISELEPPSPSTMEGTPFKIFWVFKKDGKIILPRGNTYLISPIHEYSDCEIVGQIEFRWNREDQHWSLVQNN